MPTNFPHRPEPTETRKDQQGASHFKPRLSGLLASLCLDAAYESGRGSILFHRTAQGKLIEVLDLVGGYGSLLLGHSHPELVAEAVKLLTEQRPIHAQGSIRPYAQRLAQELSRRAQGDFYAVFANSGAEAVEGAMKHALLETGGSTFIALEGGFHGKTLGALQLTANPAYRDDFNLPGLDVVRVRPNDLASLESAFARTGNPAGFFFEPIQGEGGVRPLERAFCHRAAALCAQRGIPLIADECQTGVGRTGTFLACEQLGLRPDYVILSKTLGGGLAKIAALLIDRKRYDDTFDLKHTSTYADDDYSCALALKTLELLDDSALARCIQVGDSLAVPLRELARRFPDVILEVRARGLMIGVEFKQPQDSPSLIFRSLATQGDLLFVVMGYLWHAHQLRVAPTLSDRWTLRLEPSLFLSPVEIARTIAGLEDVCQRLRDQDALGLTLFLAHSRPSSTHPLARFNGHCFAYDPAKFQRQHQTARGNRVAWLCHFIDGTDLTTLEPSFADMAPAVREWYLERSIARAGPVIMSGIEIRSRTGDPVWLCPILLPFTSSWAKRQIDGGQTQEAAAIVQHGVDVARHLGCARIALGQYTSILTRNGTRLNGRGMVVTTGNSYALLLATQALERAQRELGRRPADSILAVVGATGNIGRAAAEILAPFYRETILVGRAAPASKRRLAELSQRIPRSRACTDLNQVARAEVILVATNAVDAPVQSVHLKPGAIVCDVSVPAALSSGTMQARPDLMIIKGGIAQLPRGEDLQIVGFPLPPGQTYGCMAEVLLLGLEGGPQSGFTGSIRAEHLRRVAALADKHGFRLADYKSHCVFGSESNRPLGGADPRTALKIGNELASHGLSWR